MKVAVDWMPHDYVPGIRSQLRLPRRAKTGTRPSRSSPETAMAAMITNLLTEDNLPVSPRDRGELLLDDAWGFGWAGGRPRRHGIRS